MQNKTKNNYYQTPFNPPPLSKYSNVTKPKQNPKPVPTSTKNQNLSSSSQRLNSSMRPIRQISPKYIYKKYISNTQNVFYQDRWAAKKMSWIGYFRNNLFLLWLFVLAAFIMLQFVEGYSGRCPLNATCRVYIHCNPGYVMKSNGKQCQIDPQLQVAAYQICQDASQTLKYQYGNSQCQSAEESMPPDLKLRLLFSSYNVQTQMLQTKILELLNNRQQMQKLGVKYNSYSATLQAVQKKYSFSCSIQLYLNTSAFKYHLIVGILFFIILILFLIRLRRKHIANKYYKQFEIQLNQKDVINIEQVKNTRRMVISQSVWNEIENIRLSKKQFGYFQEYNNLYWARIN